MDKPRTMMTPSELLEFRQITLVMNNELYKAQLIERNTATIPNGREVAGQQRAIATLLVNARTEWVTLKLADLGYEPGTPCSIDITTGVVSTVTV